MKKQYVKVPCLDILPQEVGARKKLVDNLFTQYRGAVPLALFKRDFENRFGSDSINVVGEEEDRIAHFPLYCYFPLVGNCVRREGQKVKRRRKTPAHVLEKELFLGEEDHQYLGTGLPD